jgi:hypothetical protein
MKKVKQQTVSRAVAGKSSSGLLGAAPASAAPLLAEPDLLMECSTAGKKKVEQRQARAAEACWGWGPPAQHLCWQSLTCCSQLGCSRAAKRRWKVGRQPHKCRQEQLR